LGVPTGWQRAVHKAWVWHLAILAVAAGMSLGTCMCAHACLRRCRWCQAGCSHAIPQQDRQVTQLQGELRLGYVSGAPVQATYRCPDCTCVDLWAGLGPQPPPLTHATFGCAVPAGSHRCGWIHGRCSAHRGNGYGHARHGATQRGCNSLLPDPCSALPCDSLNPVFPPPCVLSVATAHHLCIPAVQACVTAVSYAVRNCACGSSPLAGSLLDTAWAGADPPLQC
jgi:hypothetical protein